MAFTLHAASVPVYARGLANLGHVLSRGEAHAAERGIAPEVLLQTRLIPDMLPLVKQVQIATDLAKNGCARLAGVDPLVVEDTETDFAQLHARIARVREYVLGFDAAAFADAESREIVINTRTAGELRFDGVGYLLQFSLPNFFFHCTTAYDILRAAGVPLGKADFIGPPAR